tara:strand:+ start:203 stop:451 length:249 start_codon:yes stop_codon:yes gene_type:complete
LIKVIIPAPLLPKATSAGTVDNVGTGTTATLAMANTKRKIKRGDLLPWFLEDHATLPQWYLDDCQEFFDWLKKDHQARKKLN